VEVHDTAIGKLGLSICYDLWFPEFMRIQVRNGCEVHVNMTANQPIFGIGSTHVPIVRAVENGVFVVSCNMIGDQRPDGGKAFMGGSSIISPFGEVIAAAGQVGEEIIYGEIDLRRIAKTRTLLCTIKDMRTDVYDVVYHPPVQQERGQ
jgi:deaminated glutathione amidase